MQLRERGAKRKQRTGRGNHEEDKEEPNCQARNGEQRGWRPRVAKNRDRYEVYSRMEVRQKLRLSLTLNWSCK